ncbi:LysR family transcriptional regulator [Tianweitania sp. BSSL-BM11]|uniref:LysR family transcriptional regulator n=1 Tax=Tianweitania aestuarii TaxID=2814886 RepID=A0ABS5S0I7_9HYPH|nr:LysR family transcriptional regulator [Tianweitania aestuarii]MBS9721979.1 LysR family transcriptional regulator [Tianweitania aestuarii]
MQLTNDPGFGHVDLRALRFLLEVLTRRNVTRAGEAMGLSQPAASRLLAQLRHALGGDPLLVRAASGGYALTARAAELLPKLKQAIAATDQVFTRPVFDPQTSERSFRIATTDYGAAVVVPSLARAFHAKAPGLSLELCAWSGDTLSDLEEGRVDFALYTDEVLPSGFHQVPLFEEGFAFLLREDHPILAKRDRAGHIAPAELAALPRVVMLYPDGTGIGVDDPLAAYGRPLGPGDLRTPHFLSAPLAVSLSDFVLCAPARMARLVAASGNLAVVDFPEAEPITYCMIWHDRADMDAALNWVRTLLKTLFHTHSPASDGA